MHKCQKFTTIVMDEMNITMYNKIRKSYDSSSDKARDRRTGPASDRINPFINQIITRLSLEQAANDLCNYAVEKSKLGNSSPFVAQRSNCWEGYEERTQQDQFVRKFLVCGSLYEGDCTRGGTCESTCGIGGYCCSKIKLEDNFDCPAGIFCAMRAPKFHSKIFRSEAVEAIPANHKGHHVCVNRNNVTDSSVTTWTPLSLGANELFTRSRIYPTTSTYTNESLWKDNEIDFEIFADKCCLSTRVPHFGDTLVDLGNFKKIFGGKLKKIPSNFFVNNNSKYNFQKLIRCDTS